MPRRCWRRLAGCIATSLTLTGALAPAEFRITQQVADYVAVQAMKDHELDRAGLLLRWSGIGNRPAQPEDLVAAIDLAFSKLEPAVVRYAHRGLSVLGEEFERCLGALSPDASLSFGGCWKDGAAITGGMRAAFQM